MADVIDDAAEYNEVYQKAAFTNQMLKLAPQTHPDFDGVHCIDCDVMIPAQRLAWGRVRCTECEGMAELKKKTVKHG